MNWKLLITSFITLFVIVDPIGNAPVFLALTRDSDARHRRRFADQAMLAATAVIFLFAFFGAYVLEYLGVSIESLTVAGGVLLGIVALDMMRGTVGTDVDAIEGTNMALVPFGTPLLAGPGAIVAAMLLMDQPQASDQLLVSLGILAALLSVWLALRLASGLVRLLRNTGVDLLTRVMGILLAAIAVEFVYQAVASWIEQV